MWGTIIGVFLGFALSEGKSYLASKKNTRGLFNALEAEIKYCNFIALEFIKADIRAPLYRLPTDAFTSALPTLIAASSVSTEQQRAIQQFYLEVESLNRGLDLSEDARAQSNNEKMEKDHVRNKLKASRLTEAGEDGISYYMGVLECLPN